MAIIIGISSSISAYKILDLAKSLKEEKLDIIFIITKNALNLVDAVEFEKFGEVYTETFREGFDYKKYLKDNKSIDHIGLSDKAELFIVAPATANTIGKLANGIADDLLTTTFLACDCPKMIAPAMNCKMWENEIVQGNVQKLKKYGVEIIMPEYGDLACGYKGMGRLKKVDDINQIIIENIKTYSEKKEDLKGKKVLVSAGPTIEDIDPVRFISNKSSGTMGYTLAKQAKSRGAQVFLVSGPVNLPIPNGIETIFIRTADEMLKKCLEINADVFIGAAAVSDIKPIYSKTKIKKEQFRLEFEQNKDIVAEYKKRFPSAFVVAFALESSNNVENAKRKMDKKNADLIISNGVENIGEDVVESTFTVISKDSQKDFTGSKHECSRMIIDEIAKNF